MSLDFDVSKIKDFANVTTSAFDINGRPQWNPVTNALVWWTIPLGIYKITEDNVDAFWKRLQLWQAIVGPVLNYADGDIWLTQDDVVAHIGLSTNATSKTQTQFMATCQKQLDSQLGGVHRSNPNRLSALQCGGWKNHPSELPPRESVK